MSLPSSAEVTERVGIHARALNDGVDAFFTGALLDGVTVANLAHHVPHVPDLLAAARARVADLSGTDVEAWHLMRQVHGARVAVVDDQVPPGAELRDVDVMVTTLLDRPLVVLAADCLPIVAAGARAVAVAHAGWRGVVAGVSDALVDALLREGERTEDLTVAIGPAIGPCCYEVGDEVRDAVAAVEPGAVTRTQDGRGSVDLRAAFRSRLRARGVTEVMDVPDAGGGRGACTACDPRWFSHRRDPRSGRHAAIIVRRGDATVGGDRT